MTMNTAAKHMCIHAQWQHMHVKISACIKFHQIANIQSANMLMLCVSLNIILANISSFKVSYYYAVGCANTQTHTDTHTHIVTHRHTHTVCAHA